MHFRWKPCGLTFCESFHEILLSFEPRKGFLLIVFLFTTYFSVDIMKYVFWNENERFQRPPYVPAT